VSVGYVITPIVGSTSLVSPSCCGKKSQASHNSEEKKKGGLEFAFYMQMKSIQVNVGFFFLSELPHTEEEVERQR
jgi:hypothetical protein